MNVQSAVPSWLQIAWACAGIGTLFGGFAWIVFIFWPYLRWSKRMMVDSYLLGQKTAERLAELQVQTKPLIDDARKLVDDARKYMEGGDLARVTKALERLSDSLMLPPPEPDAGTEAPIIPDPHDYTNEIAARRARRKADILRATVKKQDIPEGT